MIVSFGRWLDVISSINLVINVIIKNYLDSFQARAIWKICLADSLERYNKRLLNPMGFNHKLKAFSFNVGLMEVYRLNFETLFMLINYLSDHRKGNLPKQKHFFLSNLGHWRI